MTKRTKSKSGKQQEDTSFLLESPLPQTRGISEYVLPGLLFLIFVLGGSTVCWFTLQQQSSIDQLTQSYSAMQMRITKFQQGMGMRDVQASPGGLEVEERIQALEESQRQAQSQVDVALQTTQLLKSSDLSAQVWSLHGQMDSLRAEAEQVAVSSAALRASVGNQSAEVEAVKRAVAEVVSTHSALAVGVAGLTGAVAGVQARLDEQVGAVAGLSAGLEGQGSELGQLAGSVDAQKGALQANNQQVAEIKELLVAEQARWALALQEQLLSVKQTLDEQLSSSQNLHSNLKARLEAVHSQIAHGVQPSSAPEEVQPVTEVALPVAEEAESSSLAEEQEAPEEQGSVDLAAVEQEGDDVTEEPAEQQEEEVLLEMVEQAMEEGVVEEEPLIEEEPLVEQQGDLEETLEEEVMEEEQAVGEESA